ncbi:hypothetical protein QR680_017939 [Steinernema hermaphroditum]|uniref:SHSP domain-containing protein n=1 Tax=Steinernema hermaphroditum TaxID=289476 RepID=A0AA39HGC6_9BILA|nr:hypothetical protein QR680_017939 [Steinernema hermaphroditum]
MRELTLVRCPWHCETCSFRHNLPSKHIGAHFRPRSRTCPHHFLACSFPFAFGRLKMALVSSRWRDHDDWAVRRPDWANRFESDWKDWPVDWPRPGQLMSRFWADTDRWWRDWPSDWPRMDRIMPRFSSQLDRFDRDWRTDPFWRDIYPRWAEPIFKEGIDVKANITNDQQRFAVDIDAYQFKPEELQVKTLDDTLLIEGRHEDIRDNDNFTKMYFVRKYQLPTDVDPQHIMSSIDSQGRLTVEARKNNPAIEGRERNIPIEGPSKRSQSRGSNFSSPRERYDSGTGSIGNGFQHSPRDRGDTNRSHEYGYREERSTTNGGDYRRGDSRNDAFHQQQRSSSRNGFRSESRQDYRVETPGSGSQVGGTGGGLLRPNRDEIPPRSESRSESVRSVKILRKSFE